MVVGVILSKINYVPIFFLLIILVVMPFVFSTNQGIPEATNTFEVVMNCSEEIYYKVTNIEDSAYTENDGEVLTCQKNLSKIPWTLQQNISGGGSVTAKAEYSEANASGNIIFTSSPRSSYSLVCDAASTNCYATYAGESSSTETIQSSFINFTNSTISSPYRVQTGILQYPSVYSAPGPIYNDDYGGYTSCDEKNLTYYWLYDYYNHEEGTPVADGLKGRLTLTDTKHVDQTAKIARDYWLYNNWSFFNETTKNIDLSIYFSDLYYSQDTSGYSTGCSSSPITLIAYLYLDEIPTNGSYGVNWLEYFGAYSPFYYGRSDLGPLTQSTPSISGNTLIGSVNLTPKINEYGMYYEGTFSGWVNQAVLDKFSTAGQYDAVYVLVKAPNSYDPYASLLVPIVIGNDLGVNCSADGYCNPACASDPDCELTCTNGDEICPDGCTYDTDDDCELCVNGDGICREGCTIETDDDCLPDCTTNGICEPLCINDLDCCSTPNGICDLFCPTRTDPDCCGSDSWCNPLCANDPDCTPTCGNGTIEIGEECGEPNLVCPKPPATTQIDPPSIELYELTLVSEDTVKVEIQCNISALPKVILRDEDEEDPLQKEKEFTVYNEDWEELEEMGCPTEKTIYYVKSEDPIEPKVLYSLEVEIAEIFETVSKCTNCKCEIYQAPLPCQCKGIELFMQNRKNNINIDDNSYLTAIILGLFAAFVILKENKSISKKHKKSKQ